MLQLLKSEPYDVLSLGLPLVARPGIPAMEPITCGDIVADQDVPLFALVRSTVGLPLDDRRWWPERPQRRRRGSVVSEVFPQEGVASGGGRHVLVLDGEVAPAQELVHPSVALLERALSALRNYS